MYKIIIATHGNLAQSINDTLSLFVGEDKEVYSICLDDKGISEFEKKADNVIEEIGADEVLIFTDLFYGSPFNVFSSKIEKFTNSYEIIAGVNMPGILEAVLKQKDMTLKEALPSIIEANKPVIFVKNLILIKWMKMMNKKEEEINGITILANGTGYFIRPIY